MPLNLYDIQPMRRPRSTVGVPLQIAAAVYHQLFAAECSRMSREQGQIPAVLAWRQEMSAIHAALARECMGLPF